MIETGYPIVNLVLRSLGCLAYPLILLVTGFFEPDEVQEARRTTGNLLRKVGRKLRRGGGDPPEATTQLDK